jgi:hypothetical protein
MLNGKSDIFKAEKIMNIFQKALICCIIILTFAVLKSEAKTSEFSEKCAMPNAKSAFIYSKAVFVGEVLNVEEEGDIKTFTFRVEKYWKGVKSNKIKVSVNETMRYQAWFEVGEKYLVFAAGSEKDAKLWERRCSGSKRLADASLDVKELGRAKKPAKK